MEICKIAVFIIAPMNMEFITVYHLNLLTLIFCSILSQEKDKIGNFNAF